MLRLPSIACLVLIAIAIVPACGKDDPVVKSRLGESCERTADCGDSLACYAGACRPADVKLEATPKVCSVVQCEAPADCCNSAFVPSAGCASAKAACDANPNPSSSSCVTANGPSCNCVESNFACEENLCRQIECTAPSDCCADFVPSSACTMYADDCALDPVLYASECTYADSAACKCDSSVFSCTENQCVSVDTCTDDTDCFGGVCDNGACVMCVVDSDCNTNQKCTNNTCVTPECLTDVDCDAFSECQSDNTCKEVGCASDRECIVYTGNFLAICNKSSKPVPTCEVSCDNDAQCNTGDGNSRMTICVSGHCQNPGCESSEECKILHPEYDSIRGAKAVCAAAK